MDKQHTPPAKLPKKSDVMLGFDTKMIEVPLHQIIPLKLMTSIIRTSTKYMQIRASVREVGIIEPPVVSRDTKIKNRFILLDGHLRIEALKELGKEEVICLLSTDDESFTYNKHISRLSTIQEHKMIVKAVERGVSEEKIAKALSVDVSSIVRKRNLLEGICSEATELLKDKHVAIDVFAILRRLKSFRQIEIASLMNDSGVYSYSYAQALFASTPKNQLIETDKPKKVRGLNEEQMARMENEMSNLQREYKLIEESYGTDVLNLTIAKTYLSNLLSNAKIVRYLSQHHAEILSQFHKITEITSLSIKAG